jgi:DNA-binding NarL/FixJ family response regulator
VKTILLIEDNASMRRSVATMLELEGYRVLAAENGRRGIELAKAETPDLILCDIMMPGIDGYAVLKAVREHAPTAAVPFVFLTAKDEKFDLRLGMNMGADDYLTKPIDHEDLLAAIIARLERHRVRAAGQQASAPAAPAPDFSSAAPLEQLGLTAREAEVLLWVAQGKSNGDIAAILGTADTTVKKHLSHVFEKLEVESRIAAAVRALEVLSAPRGGH